MTDPQARSESTSRIISLILAVGAGALTVLWCCGSAGDILERVELKTIDARFVARGARATSGQVVIVEVDDKSLDSFRPAQWPWPRHLFARLTDRLAEAGAKAVAFDILFPEADPRDDGQSDAAFVQAAKRHNIVFLAAARAQRGEGSAIPKGAELREARIIPGEGLSASARLDQWKGGALMPFNALARASRGIGFADVPTSRDGVYRGYFPLTSRNGVVYPSLALSLASDVLGVSPGDITVHLGRSISLGDEREIPIGRNGAMLIDFAGGERTFDYYSASDVINATDDAPDDAFKDKVVFVAWTATGLSDLRPSPFGATFYGVETQANALDNILGGLFLRRQRPERVFLYTLCWALLIGFALPRLRAEWHVFVGVGAVLLHNLVAIYHFDHRGVATAMVTPTLGIALSLMAVAAFRLITQEKRERGLSTALRRLVPREIAAQLAHEDSEASARGELRTITVLFADLRGFTAAGERMGPERTVALLNRYFQFMHEVIVDFGGTLDKFVGDELMAFFNAPHEQVDHAHLAVASALEMQRRIETLRDEWAFHGMPNLAASIGICTGEAIVGYVGSGDRMQYTAIGAGVNLASRLEELGKELDKQIVINDAAYESVKDLIECADLGTFELHGIEGKPRAYEAVAMRGEQRSPGADE